MTESPLELRQLDQMTPFEFRGTGYVSALSTEDCKLKDVHW